MSDDLEILEDLLEQSGEEVPEAILDLDEFLDRSSLFAALDSEGRKALAKQATYRWVTNADTVFTEGTKGDRFAIVKSGTLLVDANFEGQVKRLAELGPGAVVGEVAVIMDTPRTATVTAEGDVELFEFSGEVIKPLMEQYPELKQKLHDLIEARSDQMIQVFLGKS